MTAQHEKKMEGNCLSGGVTIRGKGEYVVEEPIYYRINDDNSGPELLLEVCNERGWRSWDVKENTPNENGSDSPPQWQIWWRHSFPGIVYRRLKQNQVLNHIARANGLCRKDILARTLQKMSNAFPQAFDFRPVQACDRGNVEAKTLRDQFAQVFYDLKDPSAFLLPGEYTKLVAEYTRILYHSKSQKNSGNFQEDQNTPSNPVCSDTAEDHPLNIWICKPTGSSQGKGITLFKDLHELTYAGSAVVQRYLEHPLLVGGYKCDIRLYVLVTSFVPLTVYIYSEGVVRFGTDKYDLKALDNQFSHLTNTSINRMSPSYKMEKNRVGTGCKWTLRQLRRHLKSSGQRDWLLWQKVNVLVSLTLLTQVGRISYSNHNQLHSTADQLRYGTCFELYGFDILVDQNLTPWLLEVNRCPSLTYDCDVDRVVKKPLLHHLFDLVGLPKVLRSTECPLKVSKTIEGAISSLRKEGANTHKPSATDKKQKEIAGRCIRSSLCEACDDTLSKGSITEKKSSMIRSNSQSLALLRWKNGLRTSKSMAVPPRMNRILNALSYSERNINASKHFVSNVNNSSSSSSNSSSSNSERRRRSVSTHSDVNSDFSPMAEETSRDAYIPLTNNFQKLRRQLISDFSILNRYHNSNLSSLSSLESVAKPLSLRRDGRPQHKHPSKCGDWVRTFPYNAATLHGSRNSLYVKSLIAELLKYRKVCEKVFREKVTADDDFLDHIIKKLTWGDHILWSPKKV